MLFSAFLFPVRRLGLFLWIALVVPAAMCSRADGNSAAWEAALAAMPLKTNVVRLKKFEAIPLMLESFREHPGVRALVFMPGATDEFYFFNRGEADLGSGAPTLLDAVRALTNQTLIRASFLPPFLLLHTAEDPLEPVFNVLDAATAEKIRRKRGLSRLKYNDRDWDFLLPALASRLRVRFLPRKHSFDSHHFYRHSFAAWNLDGMELLQVISLAGKTTFVVEKKRVVFSGDKRFRARPPVPPPQWP